MVRQRWAIVDWLIRTNAPLWLHAVQLPHHGDALAALDAVHCNEDLAATCRTIQDASQAARTVSDSIWRLVAEDVLLRVAPESLGSPHGAGKGCALNLDTFEPAEACRLETWVLVADATTAAIQAAKSFAESATLTAGCHAAPEDTLLGALRATTDAVRYAVAGIAWRAVRALSVHDGCSWEAATEAASAAGLAVRAAFRPTEQAVRRSAQDLIWRVS